MPAIWSSSERPISVRTVWVNGIRHAILTPDDPLLDIKDRQRPRTSSPNVNSKKYVSQESFNRLEKFDNHFIEFRMLVCKKILENDNTVKRITRRQSAPVSLHQDSKSFDESRDLLDAPLNEIFKISVNDSSVDNFEHDTGYQRTSKRVLSRESSICRLSALENDDKNTSSDGIIRMVSFSNDCDESTRTEEIISSSNLLSDRVLQWMDMSGMVKNYKNKGSNQENLSDSSNFVKSKDLNQIKKQNSSVLLKKISAADNYKLNLNQRRYECDSYLSVVSENNNETKDISDEKDTSSCQDNKIQSDIILQTNKSTWSSFGRPQLHIFMPDITSSEDEMSSQDCLSNEDSLSHSDIN